ncbi:hypothetical protein BT63DRAFT_420246 [Microthyrium microscopicum]|uniref:Uncharacterized protein n=1 Tax=Microthyrium microscopicum TaxID=703497 RepID=A0A6A6UVL0_9PEZI|nr:hypothetical protein BT63DRAFT_420246 [Microthyrium microscopicum]
MHPTLILTLLAASAQACMQMGVRVNGDGAILGSIVDNGRTTCTIGTNTNSPGPDNQYWFNCVGGFAAWLSRDLGLLAYANGGNNYRFGTSNSNGYVTASGFC